MICLKTQKRLINEVRRKTGIKFSVRYVALKCGASGLVVEQDARIFINKNKKFTKAFFLSLLFHEIGHIIAYKKRIYPAYHTKYDSFMRTKKAARAYLRTALRAERCVDRIGKKLCETYYSGIKWDVAYEKQADVDWLNLLNNDIRERWGMKLYKKKRRR